MCTTTATPTPIDYTDTDKLWKLSTRTKVYDLTGVCGLSNTLCYDKNTTFILVKRKSDRSTNHTHRLCAFPPKVAVVIINRFMEYRFSHHYDNQMPDDWHEIPKNFLKIHCQNELENCPYNIHKFMYCNRFWMSLHNHDE